LCVNDNLKAAIHSRWIDEKQPENVERFKFLHNVITNCGRCTREINSRNAVTGAAFFRKNSFHYQI